MEWVREHFFDLLIGGGVLLVVYWGYAHLGRLFRSKPKNKYFCRHCNWEGNVKMKDFRCRSCGSRDLSPATH